MEFIKPDINIDFVGKRKVWITVSLIFILLGIVSLIIKGGPKYGIDFSGGTLLQLKFKKKVFFSDLRKVLKEMGFGKAIIQNYGGENEYLISVGKTSKKLKGISDIICEAFAKRFGEDSFVVRRVEMVGPKVGKALREKGLFAVLYSIVGMLIYISFRFDLKFGVGAIIALFHDVLITVGILSLTNREFTLPIIAALLTIVGYSINDTIIVYDRIRENLSKFSKRPFSEIVNRSINQTLSRTILTSGTTLLVLLALFFFGGEILRDFAFTLIVGVVVGTYSSIYIASPVVIFWRKEKKGGK